MRLQDEADAQIDVPRHIGGQWKEIARQYPDAYAFLIHQLCAKDRLVFLPLPGLPLELLMAQRDGRRFPAIMLERIVNTPMPEQTPPEPPARTITEKVRRRAAKSG